MDKADNRELELVWQLVEKTGVNIFLTGKAGTGKTTFLHKLHALSPKRMVVLAPTGVAAINAAGSTIHSFFQLPLSPYVPDGSVKGVEGNRRYQFSKLKKNIIRTLDLIVIDEISMVRADVLDAVDDVLRRFRDSRMPFGGVQLLMIGDLQQLAPVVKDEEWKVLREYYQTPYFFGSHALQQTQHVTIELKTVYRQTDEAFVALLNKVRGNALTASDVELLNTRVVPEKSLGEGAIRLTTHNRMADEYNEKCLAALSSRAFSYRATVSGTFPVTSYPADETLVLKRGAQVMFLKNDISGRHLFFNGKLAKVIDISNDEIVVRGLDDDRLISVERMEWTNVRYSIDKQTKEISEEVEGTFMQYPLRLAWAITVHKSQGLTFDRAILDVNAAFASGQVYVALSRCRTLQGLVLTAPLDSHSVITDSYVNSYIDSELEQAQKLPSQIEVLIRMYFRSLLGELFSFQSLQWRYDKELRIIDEHLYKMYPKLLTRFKEVRERLQKEVFDVAPRFGVQIDEIFASGDAERLAERVHLAAEYFKKELLSLLNQLLADAKRDVDIDNKKVAEQHDEAFSALVEEYQLKLLLLDHVASKGFEVGDYLKEKARVILLLEQRGPRNKANLSELLDGKGRKRTAERKKVTGFRQKEDDTIRKDDRLRLNEKGLIHKEDSIIKKEDGLMLKGEKPAPSSASKVPDKGIDIPDADADILYPELYQTLRRWRGAKALQEHKPAFQIFNNTTLAGIVNALPTNLAELQNVKGLGKTKTKLYGKEILEIVQDYISENAEW